MLWALLPSCVQPLPFGSLEAGHSLVLSVQQPLTPVLLHSVKIKQNVSISSPVALATFQGLCSHVWLLATMRTE